MSNKRWGSRQGQARLGWGSSAIDASKWRPWVVYQGYNNGDAQHCVLNSTRW
eukprot:jgi/Mesvir1/23721/Mv25770-RA.1